MDKDRDLQVIMDILAALRIETFLAPVTPLDPELDTQPPEDKAQWN